MNHDTASTSLDCGPKGELFLLEEVPMDQHIKSLSPGSLLDLVNSARAKILLYFPHYSDCSHQDGKLRSAYKGFPTRASTVVLQFSGNLQSKAPTTPASSSAYCGAVLGSKQHCLGEKMCSRDNTNKLQLLMGML